eukprot:3993405-Alexandrium_andersonii.AAC.1
MLGRRSGKSRPRLAQPINSGQAGHPPTPEARPELRSPPMPRRAREGSAHAALPRWTATAPRGLQGSRAPADEPPPLKAPPNAHAECPPKQEG